MRGMGQLNVPAAGLLDSVVWTALSAALFRLWPNDGLRSTLHTVENNDTPDTPEDTRHTTDYTTAEK